MRKKAILFGLLLVLLQCAWAQTVTFKKAIGDNEDNVGWSVLEIQTGYILVGGGYSVDGYSALIKMFKTDHYGNVVLSKYYGVPNRLFFPGGSGSVCKTSDGNFAIAGSNSGGGSSDALLIKFNIDLDTLWTKSFTGAGYDIFYKCRETPDKGFAMIGSTDKFGNDAQFYFVKTDSTGSLEWEKHYGSQFREIGRSFVVKPDGGYILSGEKRTSTAYSSQSPYWFTTDSAGVMLWDTIIPVSDAAAPTYINDLTDSTYMVFGGFDDPRNQDVTPFIAKTDTSGRPLWMNVLYADLVGDFVWQVRQLSDGNIILGGERQLPVDRPGFGVWLMKIDQEGELLWERLISYDTSFYKHTWLRDIQETSDKGFIITGMTNAINRNIQDMLLLKLDSLGCLEGDCGLLTNVPENQIQPVELSVFPNPTKESFTIKYALPYGLHNNPQVVLYNLQGKQVYQALLYKAKDLLKIRTTELGSGLYIYQLVSGGEVLGSGKVVVE